MKKSVVNLILLALLIVVVAVVLWIRNIKSHNIEVQNQITIEKIQALGKLELVKYQIKDILDYRKKRSEYLPDSKVLLIVVGEIVGCIDLSKITEKQITNTENQVSIKLPKVEICYSKIDHSKSKVYDATSFLLLDNESEMVDQAYKEAEKSFENKSIKDQVLKQTEINAASILKPFLEQISNKKIVLIFDK